jgi:hypothetical protein
VPHVYQTLRHRPSDVVLGCRFRLAGHLWPHPIPASTSFNNHTVTDSETAYMLQYCTYMHPTRKGLPTAYNWCTVHTPSCSCSFLFPLPPHNGRTGPSRAEPLAHDPTSMHHHRLSYSRLHWNVHSRKTQKLFCGADGRMMAGGPVTRSLLSPSPIAGLRQLLRYRC